MSCFRRTAKVLLLGILQTTVCIQALPQHPTRSVNQRVSARLENNIRAELGFLASDAMQGRGSGTNLERIAAEYIGSQFRQVGLEPAGDNDYSSRKGFVQKVTLQSVKFTEAPILTATNGSDIHTWKFGQDFLASSVRGAAVEGDLQIIDSEGTPAKGAFVVFNQEPTANTQQRQQLVRKAINAQAAGVALIETDGNKATRQSDSFNLPRLPGMIKGEVIEQSPFVSLSLSRDAFTSLSSLKPGTHVTFSGPTQISESGSTWNAIGFLRGSDRSARSQAIMLSAHLDHLGVNEAATGDKIFNGADDDASGCVAVMELARALAAGRRPRRTIYFICFGSEERGGFGARYFISNSPVPLTQIVADLTFEMIGRPDAKVKANTLWLTGFERSNLGPQLALHGASLVGDPHPEENFFQRSDNYTLALRGVVAQTVSSFGLHSDYHQPSDEIGKIDFPFMARSINSMIAPVRWLANSNFRPSWLKGQAPPGSGRLSDNSDDDATEILQVTTRL